MLGRIIARAFEEAEGEPGPLRTSRVVAHAFRIIEELPEHERRWVTEQALRQSLHTKAREMTADVRRNGSRAPRRGLPVATPD